MKNFFLIFIFIVTYNGGCEEKKEALKKAEIPTCIKEKIEQFAKEQVENPPRKITQYTYKGKTAYLISAPCCDQFEQLLDEDCNVICAPFGGFTGKGDRKCTDFRTVATNEKLIWEDTRKKSK